MARRTAGVGQRLEIPLRLLFGHLGRAHFIELGACQAHGPSLGEAVDLQQARVDRLGQIRDRLEQVVRLSDLVRSLFQSSLRLIDAPIAVVDVLLQIPHVVIVEAVFGLFRWGEIVVFNFEDLGMCLGTRTQVLFRVGEEIMRTGSDQIGAAHGG